MVPLNWLLLVMLQPLEVWRVMELVVAALTPSVKG